MDQGTMTEQNDNLSNYDKVIETWRKKFLEMDQEALIRKFQLEAENLSKGKWGRHLILLFQP